MAKKRAFQILDEMNVADIENGTRLVSISNTFIEGETIPQGAKITMGTTAEALQEIWNETHMPILVLVDKKKYNELNK